MANMPTVQMSVADLRGELVENSQIDETQDSSGLNFLKFSGQTGEWLCGRDGDDVEGENLAINVSTIGHGWILWFNQQAEKVLVPFNKPLPDPMPPKGEGKHRREPSEARCFQGALLGVDSESADEPVQVAFETNTYGARQAIDRVLGEIRTKASTSDYFYPVVKLGGDSYYNKSFGKEVFNPLLPVVYWTDSEGNREPEAVADKSAGSNTETEEAEATTEPESTNRSRSREPAETEASSQAPVRRRRRAQAE